MKIKSILLPLFAVFALSVSPVAVASDVDSNYWAYGAGGHSCAKFLKQEKEALSHEWIYVSWIQGFMSAAGLYNDTEKTFLDVADLDGIMHLIREYCEENPLNDLTNAAEVVADQLINRAGRR